MPLDDDDALRDAWKKRTGGRLSANVTCSQCGALGGEFCAMSFPAVIQDWSRVKLHDMCEPFALCFDCAKASYVALVIGQE